MRFSVLPFRMSDTGQDAGNNNTPAILDSPKPKGEKEPDGEKKFTQAELESKLDALVKDRELRLKRQFERQQQEAQQAMEAKQLEEQAEWQKLANKRADEIKELKPRAGLAESYEKGVARLMEEATKDLAANIQMILTKLPLPDQLDWLTENLDSLKAPLATGARTDINAYARTTTTSPTLSDDEYRKKKRSENIYF